MLEDLQKVEALSGSIVEQDVSTRVNVQAMPPAVAAPCRKFGGFGGFEGLAW